MRLVIDGDRCTLFHGDAADLLLPENSVDAIVCDPPAGIGFMGKAWDGDKGGRDAWIAWLAGALGPAFRALKPGGHALVWALPRTSHWTALALEECGFEIRDRVSHLFGTGFPKSLNVSKAGAGAEWDGWGTALKPACEDWWLVRKPLAGTVAENVMQHGTGGLNVNACRVGENPGYRYNAAKNGTTFHGEQSGRAVQTAEKRGRDVIESTAGRWPAHVALSHHLNCWMHQESYLCPSCGKVRATRRCLECGLAQGVCVSYCPISKLKAQNEDALQFFYVAKPSRGERDIGLGHLPPRTAGEATDREDGSAALNSPRTGAGRTGGARNFHPTVKSIALMRWLIRLITPPDGTVLDPFAGSGSTGVAAIAEGFKFIGCELTEDYLPITEGRLRYALAVKEGK